jgi:hypothetical protein
MAYQTKEKWLLTLASGGFLFFVLYVYEGFGIPGGISDTGHGLLFRSASFGLLASLSFGLNEFFLRDYFLTDEIQHRAVWYVWELIVIWNLTYLLINIYWSWGSYSWFAYFDLLGEMTAVMIVPFALTEVYRRLQVKEPDRDHVRKEKLVFESSNDKERLVLSPDQFLYATSSDNYVEIFYLMGDTIKQALQRNTLKSIEESFEGSESVMRCHRSFIINPQHIVQFSESSRGGDVTLTQNVKLQVSKKYSDKIRRVVMSVD